MRGWVLQVQDVDEEQEQRRQKVRKKVREKARSGGGAAASVAPTKQLVAAPPSARIPQTHQYVAAPMVGGSELAFRVLVRRYGCQLTYTPMMNAAKFVADASYREQELQLAEEDHPIFAHFAANDPSTLVAAARLAKKAGVDGIDINLGCPQRIAHSGHFGSFLLGEEDRDLVLSMVRAVANDADVSLPVTCKIRLCDTEVETVRLCEQLRDAGAALIAVHARHRVRYDGSSGRRVSRQGAAMLEQIRAVKLALGPDFPVIANGNTKTFGDVQRNLESTGADGVMSAEGLLDNPALFSADEAAAAAASPTRACKLALEYLKLARAYPVAMPTLIFHLRRMLRADLNAFQLTEELMGVASAEEARSLVKRLRAFRKGKEAFEYDTGKAAREKEAADRRKRERNRRADYEARMRRKAAREGLPLDHYVSRGATAPTLAELAEMREKLATDAERLAVWKERFGQHCFAHHFAPGGCKRERTCAFLHAETVGSNGNLPSWLEEK